jgi:hypothetical protein
MEVEEGDLMDTGTEPSSARQVDVEQEMAMIEKGQQLAGHFPDTEALGRARRILEGTMTGDEAMAELDAKYGFRTADRKN